MRRSLSTVRWLQPGLGVKRWLLLAALGATLFVNGVSRYLTDEGVALNVNEWVDSIVNEFLPPAYLSWIFMIAGALLVMLGIWRWLNSIVSAVTPLGTNSMIDAIIGRRLERGYRIVVVGGGTGLSTMLRGLKKITTNLTAVVTVSDDGGSSGRLQKELGVLPPGDIRNCLVALADDEALVTELFRYRFREGEGLSGHSFGNLFLAAMTGITGNFDEAIKVSSRVLNVKGRVLPSTLAVSRLCARMTDGRVIAGESTITAARGTIDEVYLDPAFAPPLDEVITAIREADAIVLGPGSLFTSIMPNLLVDQIGREIEAANAIKIYVCNVMTQPGETDGYSASRHVRALLKGAKAKICDVVV
ncbi:MAG: uridine diphosphate-N-acetylglucosamine-binding protein YvcK, partial [Candidatus Eremiobacterales bacterium]